MPLPETAPVGEGKDQDNETPKITGKPGGTGSTASTTGNANHAATGNGSGTKASLAAASGGGGTGSENIPADDPNAPKGKDAAAETVKASEEAPPEGEDTAAEVPGEAPPEGAAAAAETTKAPGVGTPPKASAAARAWDYDVKSAETTTTGDAGAAAGIRDRAESDAGSGSAHRSDTRYDAEPTRMDVLKQRLIVEHQEAKRSRDMALEMEEELDFIKHTDRVANNQKLDNAASGTGLLGTAGVVIAALGPTLFEQLGDSDMQKKAKRASSSDIKRDSLTDGEKTFQDAFNWIGLAGNAFGALSGGLKTASSIYRAKTDKNKHNRRTARYRALSGAFSMGGSIAAGFSNAENLGLLGGWGMERGSAARKRGGIADMIAGIGGIGEKVLDYFGNLQEAHGYSSASRAIGKYINGIGRKAAKADTGQGEDQTFLKDNGDIPDNLSDNAKAAPGETGLEARRTRKTAKAQKYAMEQAKNFNDARTKNPLKGAIGAVGGIAGGIGSILTGISKGGGGLSNEFGAFGSIFSAIGGGAKALGALVDKGFDKSEEKRLHREKEEVITNYLDEKIVKIKKEADSVRLDDTEKEAVGADKLNLTDDEARTIAIMRLGVALPDKTSDLSKLKHDSAVFQKITEKRAKNILMSEPKEKKAMLKSLGLDQDAAFEDVVRALTAGWDPSVGLVDKATVPVMQKGKSLKNKISRFFHRH